MGELKPLRLENLVSTLESSIRLRDLGVPQESLFYWIHDQVGFGIRYKPNDEYDGIYQQALAMWEGLA